MVEIIPQFFRQENDNPVKRWMGRMDWGLFAAVMGLSIVGLAFVHSATAHGGGLGTYVVRQGAALIIGMAGMILLALLPYQLFQTYAKPIFAASVLALVAVLIVGTRLRGFKSWFHLGFFYFQPVELTRLALAAALAAYAEARARDMGNWRALVAPLALTGIHLALILKQPDLSSALSLGPMCIAILFAAGASLPALAVLMGTAAVALGIPLASTFFSIVPADSGSGWTAAFIRRALVERGAFIEFWGGMSLAIVGGWWFLRKFRIPLSTAALFLTLGVLGAGVTGSFAVKHAIKDYQRKRLIAFLDPAIDPLGSGYNIRQSKIALGSGRFLGKGYLSGSQSQLGFLPEKHTDFIFSLIGEEIGFAGALLTLGLYFWIVFRAYEIASKARDRFGRYLAVGIGTHFAFTGLVNMGMVMGLMPVAGLPLPFLSYGGSSLVGAFLAVGLLMSIYLRRYIL